jgi:surface protein
MLSESLVRPRIYAETCEPFGSQMFYTATSFNQNLAAWNTASVTAMTEVCASV